MGATRNLSHFVRHLDGCVARMELEFDGLPRAGCTQAIEGDLAAIPDITLARVSVADRRVAVEWRDGKVDPVRFIKRLSELGYPAHPCEAAASSAAAWKRAISRPLACLGVAVLAALSIRLLAVLEWPPSVAAADITPDQRDVFDWLCAAIAFSAVAWAGRPFFVSAVRAVWARRLNRETPVSVAVVLAFILPLFETPDRTLPGSWESGLLLLALALAARMLEQAVLNRAPTFAGNPVPSANDNVTKFVSDTELADAQLVSIRPGDLVLVRPGERIAVDGIVSEGRSEIDQSLVTGETLPVSVARDSVVHAGALNVSGT